MAHRRRERRIAEVQRDRPRRLLAQQTLAGDVVLQKAADANAPAEVAPVDEPPPAPIHAPSREGRIDSIVVSVAVPETWFDAAGLPVSA